MAQEKIGFIGAGNMARSLAGGLIQNGWDKSRLSLADPDADQRRGAEQALGLTVIAENPPIADTVDILVLAIKPQVCKTACVEIAATLQARSQKPLIISLAAGIRSDSLEQWLGDGLSIVRTMPNTAALIGSGATGLYANRRVDSEQRNTAESILRAVGVTVWLQDESLMNAVTALSGSGPAYFFLVMEALETAAIKSGLDADTARLLTLETAFGAAKMALEGQEEPRRLRERVTSPGGTTEAAVAVFESGNIFKLFEEAFKAAMKRSQELADMFGGQ